jgi:hypothetical protein
VDKRYRPFFNTAFSPSLYQDYTALLTAEVGPIPFRLAETPLFVADKLRTHLATSALEIVTQLSLPALVESLKAAIPKQYNVPGMDGLPNCVQVDFALCEGPHDGLAGRVVELQAFPSLYALMDFKARVWNRVLQRIPGLDRAWTCYLDIDVHTARQHVQAMLLDDEDPSCTVLVDIAPEKQKTAPDFEATRLLYGVESECITRLKKRGNRLFRMRQGKEVPVRRIYNRLVFDELEAKGIQAPFHWNEPLAVTWCSHPNWYWVWSKYVLPQLKHPTVPRTQYLADVDLQMLPEDLSGYVLKPLFSFAGAGVKVDVTRHDLRSIPLEQRTGWVLQDKIPYAHVLCMPDGTGIKAEVRVMLLRAPKATTFTPLLFLVRLSRGKMIGVDHNKDLTWVGGSVGIF